MHNTPGGDSRRISGVLGRGLWRRAGPAGPGGRRPGLPADAGQDRRGEGDPPRRHDRVRRDAQVAAVDDHQAADRRADHADLREVGRSRRQGARLMQIDPQRQQAAVSSQEAERAAREADVAYARQQQQRASELFTAGAISKQELEQAQTALADRRGQPAGAAGAGPAAAGAAALLHRHRADLRHRRRRAGPRRHAGVVADDADDDRAERYARGVRAGADRAVARI